MSRGYICGWVLSLSAISFLAGCGSSTMSIAAIEPSLKVEARAAAEGTTIEIGEFRDVRENMAPDVVGEAKTGFFNASTKMVSAESVSVTVAEAVKRGFEQAGFTIAGDQDPDYMVSGEIEKFEANEHATGVSLEYAKAYVKYDLLIRNRQGKSVWGGTMDKYVVSETCWDATGKDAAVLSQALRDSVEAIFADDSFWQAVTQ